MQGLSAVAPSGTPEWSFQIRNPFGLLDFLEEEIEEEEEEEDEKRIIKQGGGRWEEEKIVKK